MTAAAPGPGDALPALSLRLTRADLVRYAGASGDFNPIHWNERFAVGVGLPNVIAHGMLTMALAGRLVTHWIGDPGAVVGYAARFTRPVVVPDDDEGVVVRVAGTVKSVEDGRAAISLEVTCGEEKVLGMPKAVLLVDG